MTTLRGMLMQLSMVNTLRLPNVKVYQERTVVSMLWLAWLIQLSDHAMLLLLPLVVTEQTDFSLKHKQLLIEPNRV